MLSPPTLSFVAPRGGAQEKPSPHPSVVKVMVINPGALSLLFGVNWLAAFGQGFGKLVRKVAGLCSAFTFPLIPNKSESKLGKLKT